MVTRLRKSTVATGGPRVNDAESPLGLLRLRRDAAGQPLISEPQFLAGERLRADYTLGRMEQRTTANWDAPCGRQSGVAGSSEEVAIKALAARDRLFRALEAVGPELSAVLLEVCCLCAGLEQAERRLALPVRSGKAVLGLALTRLARHYGFLAAEADQRRHPLLRLWTGADYRPTLTR